MSYQQQEKERIRSNKAYMGCYALLGLCAIPFLWMLGVQVLPIDNILLGLLFIVLVVVGVVLILVFLARRNERDAQTWFELNGHEVLATVTAKKEDPSQRDGEGNPAYLLQLAWRDPVTGTPRSFWEETYEMRYKRYAIGSHLMVQYDPQDLSFHEIRWYR
ncbi:MAG TPA: DUF3592 domain-containing protein [Ktedonobacteraceae bacterium]|nr:DUF3592 domain-containing protein [Ktedonobacteraceae bacterium]